MHGFNNSINNMYIFDVLKNIFKNPSLNIVFYALLVLL